jgi:hypothetical protein
MVSFFRKEKSMELQQIFENPHWEEFKSKAREKLKQTIAKEGLEQALDKLFSAFCVTFQEAIKQKFKNMPDSQKEDFLVEFFIDFTDEILKDPS